MKNTEQIQIEYDFTIIGCGIVGAAIAYGFSKYNCKVLVLEKENDVAKGATRANSAIIHAGFDPFEGSLMAKLNVRGAELAESICRKLDVPYQKNGALVLGYSKEDINTLKALLDRGIANGVKNLRIVDREEIMEMEPHISDDVMAALYAPDSAICSPWEYCLAMTETAVRNGVELELNSEVIDIKKDNEIWTVRTKDRSFHARCIINAAGVSSQYIHELVAKKDFTIIPNRGQYYLLDKSEGKMASHTLFRCPSKKGKGVLVSPTVNGNIIVGPDSETVTVNDTSTTAYGLDEVKRDAKMLIPKINFNSNIRNFAGVRARSDKDDFTIQECISGFIDVAGICSPGLSSAPAIAEYVIELLKKSGFKFEEKDNYIDSRKRIRFHNLSDNERKELIKENPDYGNIICRCETITEGEIRAAFHTPIPPTTVDAVKRRVGSGMGRCQGGFCGPQIVRIIAEELGIRPEDVLKDSMGSNILEERNV